MMTDKPLLISLMKKAENFAYHSFKYLDDDVQVDTVLLNTPDIVLLKKKNQRMVRRNIFGPPMTSST